MLFFLHYSKHSLFNTLSKTVTERKKFQILDFHQQTNRLMLGYSPSFLRFSLASYGKRAAICGKAALRLKRKLYM
ncbi:hypothetical protein AF333_16560 [Aneurinibacillus migulanus]|uniref:Uncharacterized protein n=1 Tax=Aneurinibacillus migulanus TaxID=47500 RepID=A0A0M0H433_ANEMI|nr:hypothetical protein AF333_16560 [Aneurinibacillus migulanus]